MFKIILLCLSLFVVGFLIVHEGWYVTLTAFGYQITTSVILFLIALLIVFYLLYLAQKPFGWIKGFQHARSLGKMDRKETYLTQVLTAFLSGDENAGEKLLKNRHKCYPSDCLQTLLVQALLQPSPDIFEKLLQTPQTKLIGIKGLLEEAWKTGNLPEAAKLVKKAVEISPETPWVKTASFKMCIAQQDWSTALDILESQKKSISKECFKKQKALLLLKLGHNKEAFETAPELPMTALAYARSHPEKAKDIFIASWQKEPSHEIFLAYENLISSLEAPNRVKAVEKLIAKNKANRFSILALAETALNAHLWGMAREQMEIYIKSYPLTQEAALLMARVEREGWNHESEALKWEEKAKTIEKKAGWFCTSCGHEVSAFQEICPSCQNFGTLCYQNQG